MKTHQGRDLLPRGPFADGLESVPTPRAGFFGITTPDHLFGIAMAYQVAQKLHAATDPDDPPEFLNDTGDRSVELVEVGDPCADEPCAEGRPEAFRRRLKRSPASALVL